MLNLLGSKEIAVRAWDESNNTQPEKLNWNVMGMFNNSWYRVRKHVSHPDKGEVGLVFEHPVQPANGAGGWMAHKKQLAGVHENAQSSKESASASSMSTSAKKYTMEEVSKHSTCESAWIVIHGHVYDCTSYIKDHPGGADSILINAGTDCTEEFDSIHSDKAKEVLEKFRIGELITIQRSVEKEGASDLKSPNQIEESPVNHNLKEGVPDLKRLTYEEPSVNPNSTILRALANPREKVKCTLVEKTVISRDTRIFRFALPLPEQVLGLPVGKHIFLSAIIDEKLCLRAYTPSSHADEKGHFDLVVKVYFKGENPKYPNGGVMSQHLDSLPLGSTIDIKGPLGEIEYTGRGNFLVKGQPLFAKKLAMIAGGTGITPIYQVIQAILRDQPDDKTEMHLVYANWSEDDILLRQELDKWAAMHPDRLKIWYVVNQVKNSELDWKYSVGYVTESILREHVPLGMANDTLALICGPPPMIKLAVLPNLEKMGYDTAKSCLLF